MSKKWFLEILPYYRRGKNLSYKQLEDEGEFASFMSVLGMIYSPYDSRQEQASRTSS
jgi:hypothetical protein